MRRVWVSAMMAVFAGGAAYGIEPDSPSNPPEEMSPAAASLHASRTSNEVAGRARLSDQRWVGQPVYSREGGYLGDVAALNEDDHSEIYVDIAGFLALGETTVRILPEELLHVRADGLVLRLTEPEARRLPPAETGGEQF